MVWLLVGFRLFSSDRNGLVRNKSTRYKQRTLHLWNDSFYKELDRLDSLYIDYKKNVLIIWDTQFLPKSQPTSLKIVNVFRILFQTPLKNVCLYYKKTWMIVSFGIMVIHIRYYLPMLLLHFSNHPLKKKKGDLRFSPRQRRLIRRCPTFGSGSNMTTWF